MNRNVLHPLYLEETHLTSRGAAVRFKKLLFPVDSTDRWNGGVHMFSQARLRQDCQYLYSIHLVYDFALVFRTDVV